MRYLLILLSALPGFAQGIVTTVAGSQWVFPDDGQPAINAALSGPQGLTLDPQGNLYIASPTLNMLLKLSPSGIILVVAGNGLKLLAGYGRAGRAASTCKNAHGIEFADNLSVEEES